MIATLVTFQYNVLTKCTKVRSTTPQYVSDLCCKRVIYNNGFVVTYVVLMEYVSFTCPQVN